MKRERESKRMQETDRENITRVYMSNDKKLRKFQSKYFNTNKSSIYTCFFNQECTQ